MKGTHWCGGPGPSRYGGHSHCKGMGKSQGKGRFGDVVQVWEMKNHFYATISMPLCPTARSHSETSGFCFVPVRELLSQGRPLHFQAAASPEPAPRLADSVFGWQRTTLRSDGISGPSQTGTPPSSFIKFANVMIWKSNSCFLPRIGNPFSALLLL